VLFERDELELTLRRGLSALSGVRELLTPTTLALSAALRFDDPEVGPFGRALAGIANVNFRHLGGFTNPIPSALSLTPTTRMFTDAHAVDQIDERAIAIGMLKLADLGIDDVEVIRDDTDPGTGRVTPRLHLVHSADGERLSFDMAQESTGTRTWLALIGPVLNALKTGQVLLFDEIDASLHPHLSAYLLTLFQDPKTNPRGAQLIFSTHDTSLLGHLNRDEVWLTEKGDDGATRLTALAEYGGDKVRRSTNLERAYLQGRFGAVPQIDQVAVRHALGLSA
jgi:uncharacterized protein